MNVVTVYGDRATVAVSDSSGSTNTLYFTKEAGLWKFYGNQQYYRIIALSVHEGTGYYASIQIRDPMQRASSPPIVTRGGLPGPVPMTWDAAEKTWNAWHIVDYGASPPSYASFHIDIPSEGASYDVMVNGSIGFATNLTPSGILSGPLTSFSFVAPSGAQTFSANLMDANGNIIWRSGRHRPDTTIPYTGPQLPMGNYRYQVISEASYSETGQAVSLAYADFTNLVLYDDFSGTAIDLNKWQSGELSREIVDGKLSLKVATKGVGTSDDLFFRTTSPAPSVDSIVAIEADAVLLAAEAGYDQSNPNEYAIASARIGGYFYNINPTPTSVLGDVNAYVRIGSDRGRLRAGWMLRRIVATDGSAPLVVASGTFPDVTVVLGQTYRLSIRWDASSRTFTFGVKDPGGTQHTTTYTVSDTTVSPPYGKGKVVGASAGPIGSVYFPGSVTATIDNVVAKDASSNLLVSDDFSSSLIDQTKWNGLELVKEIRSGQLFTRARMPVSGASSSTLYIVNPDSINIMQAKVRIDNRDLPPSVVPSTGLAGTFYNNGSQDVSASVILTRSSPSVGLVAKWSAGNANGIFLMPVSFDENHILQIAWNGSSFTFRVDDEYQSYTPTGTIIPALHPSRILGSGLSNTLSQEAALIAQFDDVFVGFSGGRISGSVKDPSGTGIGNVTVNVMAPGNIQVASGTTDSGGNFSINITSGSYTIEVTKTGYEMISTPPLVEITSSYPNGQAAVVMVSVDVLPLGQGWNFISFPKQPPSGGNISTVLGNASPLVAIIWGFDNSTKTWKRWRPGAQDNGLTSFESGKGYWIYMTGYSSLDMQGWQTVASTSVQLYQGWNLVGWMGPDGAAPSGVVNTPAFTGKWIILWTWEGGQWRAIHSTVANLPVERIDRLGQKKAYWFRMAQALTWTQ